MQVSLLTLRLPDRWTGDRFGFGDDGIQELVAWLPQTLLNSLELVSCSMKPDDVRWVAAVLPWTRLTRLHIAGTCCAFAYPFAALKSNAVFFNAIVD